jgi:hypothetical protein
VGTTADEQAKPPAADWKNGGGTDWGSCRRPIYGARRCDLKCPLRPISHNVPGLPILNVGCVARSALCEAMTQHARQIRTHFVTVWKRKRRNDSTRESFCPHPRREGSLLCWRRANARVVGSAHLTTGSPERRGKAVLARSERRDELLRLWVAGRRRFLEAAHDIASRWGGT